MKGLSARVGSAAPELDLLKLDSSSNNPSHAVLSDYRGRWLLLIFYPRDFSFVCPTELSAFSNRYREFQDRGCDILGASVDSIDMHREWLNTPATAGGVAGLRFALASDPDGRVAERYGVFHRDQRVAGRGLFIVDREGILQYAVVHNMNVGRSTDEILRVLDALQNGGMCASGWMRADGTIDPRLDLKEGRVIGNYRIEELLGEGSFGWVFAACDLLLERRVAIKVGRSTSEEDRQAALQEARAEALLSHRNICPVYSIETAAGMPLIVMEYLAGGSLGERLAQRALSAREATQIAAQVLAALEASHAAGIVHGDIKPGNILFSRDGTPKLTDFGIARRIGHDGAVVDGIVRGTPAYMSPEQTQGVPLCPTTDIFSCGLLIYELFTGERAIRVNAYADALEAICDLEPSALTHAIPEPYRLTWLRMLAADPALRPKAEEAAAVFAV